MGNVSYADSFASFNAQKPGTPHGTRPFGKQMSCSPTGRKVGLGSGNDKNMHRGLLPFALAIALPCAAQELHLSGGFNGTNVHEAGEEHWTGRAGYQFGADLLIGDRWFLKPGVHFLVRNINYTYSAAADVPQQEFRYTSRSLAVPIMLGLNLMDPANDPPLNIYALGGPTAIMKLDADLDNNSLDVETSPAQWYIGFGAGATFSFLFAEAGYNVAMTNVFKGEGFRTNPKADYGYLIAGVRLKFAE